MNNQLLIYNNNKNLKAAGATHEYSKQELEEYKCCYEDPIYFIENYCYINTLDDGLTLFKLYECQKKKIKLMHENRKTIFMEGRQGGKCFHKDTEYTIRNKKTGEIKKITAEEFHILAKSKNV